MKIIPINRHVLIEPVSEQGAFQSSQTTYEERGKVLALDENFEVEAHQILKIGDYCYFDSWCAAKYKDAEGNEHWVVPFEKIRAVEKE